MFSRRDLLALSAAGAAMVGSAHAATFGNPDEPAQGAINAKTPSSLTDPGPQTPDLAKQFPDVQSPPATDVGGLPLNWASFNNASRRIQNGGWARQVTDRRFRDLEGNLRRQHAAFRRRHPRAALAPGGRMGDHDLRHLPRHRPRHAGPPLRRRRQGGRPLVLPSRCAAFPARTWPGRLRIRDLLRRRPLQRIQYAAGHGLVRPHAARSAGQELRCAG